MQQWLKINRKFMEEIQLLKSSFNEALRTNAKKFWPQCNLTPRLTSLTKPLWLWTLCCLMNPFNALNLLYWCGGMSCTSDSTLHMSWSLHACDCNECLDPAALPQQISCQRRKNQNVAETRHQRELSDDVAGCVSDVPSLHECKSSVHHATPAKMVYT